MTGTTTTSPKPHHNQPLANSFHLDTLVYTILKEPLVDTHVALEKLTTWIETYDFELILDRLFTHFRAYAQNVPVDYITQEGTKGQWEAFPGELLDGITRVCTGCGDHKLRIQLLCKSLIRWYSEIDTYVLTESFIKEVTGYLLTQIDAFAQRYHSFQNKPIERSSSEIQNQVAFIYYLLVHLIQCIEQRTPVKLKVFDLLDRILESLPSLPGSLFSQIHGSDTSLHVWCIEKIMNVDWVWDHTLPLAALFKDLTLEEELVELILPRFIRQMPLAPPEDLPMLTYHVLLITKKIQTTSKRRQVFSAISDYFNHLNEASSKEPMKYNQLMVKESSTLLHMCTAISQDNTLGNEYFAFVKTLKRRQITSFNISLMLSITKIKFYKEPILLHLKKEIEGVMKLRTEIDQFIWLEAASPFSVPDMILIFQDVLKKTTHNWEILDGLMELACSFLFTSGTTTPWWLSSKNHFIQGYSIPTSLVTYQFHPPPLSFEEKKTLRTFSTNDLGLFILSKLFEMHELVREAILDLIVAQITSKSSSASSHINLLHLLLTSSIRASTSSSSTSAYSGLSFILSHIRTLELLLDQVQYLPVTLACSLLDVLMTMTPYHAGFRNTVILFLRKSMVNKRADLREASIHGGLTLLQLAYTSDLGTSFLYEILNILRRCLQFTQTDLKLMFYIQLASILEDHPGLGIYVIEPLETALAPYLTSSSHISLETCIEESVIKEPVHWLMKCVVMAHHSAFTSMSDPDITSFQTQWTSIATKLHQIDITEKFPIGICFGLSPDCLPHLLRALLYLGCLEALMEFLFLFPNQSLPLLDVLSEKRDLLIRYIQQNYIDAKGRKGTSSSTLQSIFDSAPFFSIPTLVRIIPKHPTLTKSLLTQLSLAVQQHAEYPWTLETAVITSKLLLAALSRDQMELQTERLRQDPKSFRYLFSVLTSFKSIYTQSLQSPWFSNYIQALPSFNHLFQLANDLLLYSLSKEAMLLFQILIQTPLSYIHDQRTLQQQVLALVCSTSLLDTDIIMKPLFQLLFHLSKQMTGMLVFVARNLLYRWGKITNPNASTHSTEEVTDLHLSSKEILDCLESHKSQLQAAFALCEEIEKYIGEIERCLVEFKSEYGKKDVTLPPSIQEILPQFDEMLCQRFSVVLNAVLLLSQSTVKPELSLVFVKMLTRTFVALNMYLQFKEKWTFTLGESLNVVKLGSQLHEAIALLQLTMDQTVMSRQVKQTNLLAKAMATLILHVEQFDIFVIQLAKRFKPLLRFIKRSVVRDFRFETHRISVDEKESKKNTKEKVVTEKTKKETQKKRRKLSTF